jgi:tol-pal system-associated acyl-CoA thioesterase
MLKSFVFPLRVYVEDTDFGGFVYHSNYLNFMERARTELLAAIKLDITHWADQGLFFVIRHAEVSYTAPAKLNARLQVHTEVEKVKGSSILFKHRIVHEGEPETSVCEGEILVVCINSNTQPVRVPEELREAIA